MKIINKRNAEVEFGFMEEGNVFITNTGKFYMKIESTYGNSIGEYQNAVNLQNGELDYCADELMVCPVRCELVIV